jgi:cyanate lyase
MTKNEMKDAIPRAKKEKALTWEQIVARVGMGTVWVTSACLGMNSMPKQSADKVCESLGLGGDISEALQVFPHKAWDKAVPQVPSSTACTRSSASMATPSRRSSTRSSATAS